MTERGEGGYARAGGGMRFEGGFEIGAGRFDLGVPGLVADCIKALYRSTGVPVAQRDRLPYVAVLVGVILGLVFGFHRGGILYGPIGAALGVVFGVVGGALVGLLLHFGASPVLRPEAEAIRQVRLGNFRNAVRAIRRAKMWVWRDRNAFERVANLVLTPLGIGRSDLPPQIASANLAACEGILAESLGDVEEAANSYLCALDLWPGHSFVLASLVELVLREQVWDRAGEVVHAANRFLERARDPRIVSAVKHHVKLLEKNKPREETPAGEKLREEAVEYGPGGLPLLNMQCRILENPGSQVSNGRLILKGPKGGEKVLKLSPMPFHFVLTLAEYMKMQEHLNKDPSQAGWVTIQELLERLPWTTPHVTNSNVHKLVYKVRTQLAGAGIDRNLIEENLNGCYRLRIVPRQVTIEKAMRT